MTPKECAEILRSFIRHREKMHSKEIILVGKYGSEAGRGHIAKEDDILYHATKFALTCVEEKFLK